MDTFEVMTWIAALLFVMLGMGFPGRDRLGAQEEPGLENDGSGSRDEESGPDKAANS